MFHRVGPRLRALAACSPSAVRGNDFFREQHAEVLRTHERRALDRVWNVSDAEALCDFEREMLPYLADPFRGTVERRVLAPGESSQSLMVTAAKRALEAAKLAPGDVDLLLCASFPSGQVGIGEAAFVSRELGLKGSAFNVESACASALVALDLAASFVEARRYKRVLVVTACTYSRVCPPEDTLCWTVGDGAAALVVEAGAAGAEVLGAYSTHTAESCDALHYVTDPAAPAGMRMRTLERAREALRETSERTVPECCLGALDAAGVSLSEIALVVPNSPTAWFASFVARKLGLPRERVVDTYPRYANIGPALWPTSLHLAAREHRLHPGDLVLVYAIGSVASAAAAVLRWGDVALGPELPLAQERAA